MDIITLTNRVKINILSSFGSISKIIICVSIFTFCILVLSTLYASTASAKPLKAEKADEWTELFNRMEPGWLGADGIYSLPLNGQDSKIGSADSETITFFTFCDSFLGSIDQRNLRFKEFKFSHNTAAILKGAEPNKDNIEFFYGKNASNKFYSTSFDNSLYGYDIWPQDCIIIDNVLHIIGFRVNKSMITIAVDEIRIPLVDGMPDFENFTVNKDLPLFIDGSKYETFFGGAILDNTAEAGAMNPDGYVYIYGTKTNKSFRIDKKLVVARVKKEYFGDISKWRFYDGKDWKEGVLSVDKESAALTDRVSNELSVTPIETGIYAGKYMLVFSHDHVEYRIGDTPYGPFGPAVKAYKIPEPDIYENAVTYNAKAHPHLSKPGELLISYNVNKHGSFPDTNEVYRPRFITLKLDEFAERETKSKAKSNVIPGKPVTASHGNDTAALAVDGKIRKFGRWYGHGDGDKWLMVDLDGEYTLSRWVVKHSSSGGEITAFNTRSYKLQKSMDGVKWIDVDTVEYNIEPFTDRSVEPFDARFVRLYITKPSQSIESAARIYEFEVYGEEKKTRGTDDSDDDPDKQGNQTENPVEQGNQTEDTTEPEKNDEKNKEGSPRTNDNSLFTAIALTLASIIILSMIRFKFKPDANK